MHEQNDQLELEFSSDYAYAEYTHMIDRRLSLPIDLRELVISPVDSGA